MSLARAFAGRVRRGLVRRANLVLDRIEEWAGETPTPWATDPPTSGAPPSQARVSPFAPAPGAVEVAPPPRVEPAVPDGPQLTFAQVETLFDDMVRPALQSDGGDITLVRVENNDIFVQLVGACSTCSSSVVTMRSGIERLLREEFPHFRELHEVTGPA